MGKEETVMLIRLLHTSPLTMKQNKSGNMEKKKRQTTAEEWAVLLPLSLIGNA